MSASILIVGLPWSQDELTLAVEAVRALGGRPVVADTEGARRHPAARGLHLPPGGGAERVRGPRRLRRLRGPTTSSPSPN
ncbi:hypothetical protein LT493_43855 [Streptomyces tricolor]|nr:hypothetical protein [Streptomyces tricolor]